MTTFMRALSSPTDIVLLPDGRAVVTQREGDIAVRERNGTVRPAAARIEVTPVNNEQGLLGVVSDPDFLRNHALFFYASIDGDWHNKHKVLRGVLADDGTLTMDAKAVVDMGLEGPANHDGGGLFIAENHIYVSVGDTGYNATPPANKYGSCLNRPNGKILRVNLDGSIPTDNPLVSFDKVTGCDSPYGDFALFPPDKRIFAWGFRNPYRFWVDARTGLLWVGDVGESTREEVSVGGKGAHFGYPFIEGTHVWAAEGAAACRGMTPPTECTPPALDWQNLGGAGESCAIGGLIPDDCGWPADYRNRYFFGDWGNGRIWTLDVKPDRTGVLAGSRKDFGVVGGLAGFRMGPDGGLYVVSYDSNSIVRIFPKNRAACTNAAAADAAPGDASVGDASLAGLGLGGGGGGRGGGGTDGDGMNGGVGGANKPAASLGSGCGCRLGGEPQPTAIGFLVAVCVVRRKTRQCASRPTDDRRGGSWPS